LPLFQGGKRIVINNRLPMSTGEAVTWPGP